VVSGQWSVVSCQRNWARGVGGLPLIEWVSSTEELSRDDATPSMKVIVPGSRSLVYERSKNSVGLQNTANKPGCRIGFQTSTRTPYVVLQFADRICDSPPRTLKTERCSRRPRLQFPINHLVHHAIGRAGGVGGVEISNSPSLRARKSDVTKMTAYR
jgi:hypothetical protein